MMLLKATVLLLVPVIVSAFTTVPVAPRGGRGVATTSVPQRRQLTVAAIDPSGSNDASGGYARQSSESATAPKKQQLYPNAGDVIRYYDVDGGKDQGEVLVGKISFIQTILGKTKDLNTWSVEITQLEDVGDGFYAEYSSRQRLNKKTSRPLAQVSPIAASFVRSDNAFRVPRDVAGLPAVRAEQYDIDTYTGPFTAINQDVLDEDWELYSALKGKLLRQALLGSAAGAVIANFVKGTEDAAIYAAGSLAGVIYLFFLSIKTDTIGSDDSKLGSGISNFRFVSPLFVFVGIALYNKSLGDANPVTGNGIFSSVTPEQFGVAILGFFTYRIPLFANQLSELLKDENMVLPGSAGVAMKLASNDNENESEQQSLSGAGPLTNVLLVSGPQAAGRTRLVQRLIAEGSGRYVPPKTIDRVEEGAKFEQLESRNQFITVDGRYGVTKEGILTGANRDGSSVVVVDADVATVEKLRKVPGLRLIGVWVGLDATEKFQARLKGQLQSGDLQVPEDETEVSFLRAKIKDVVKDIEYGLVSGIFEFTILNDDEEESIQQLRQAGEYCFK